VSWHAHALDADRIGLPLLALLLLPTQNYMYLMRYGNYTWWNPHTYELLKRRSSSAQQTNRGFDYNGWYFYQEDNTFNNFM
jgi:hypothetical protein